MNVAALTGGSQQPAERRHGVCRGTLWLQRQPKGRPVPRSLFGTAADGKASCEYAVLTGVHLRSYESAAAHQRGDAMVASLHVVGASAWNPPTDGQGLSLRLVTDQGTHVYCQAPSRACRDVWLDALRTGLERALEAPLPPTLPRPQPQKCTVRRSRLGPPPRHCLSCGIVEGGDHVVLLGPASPLPQYGRETRVEICADCFAAQGLLDHLGFVRDCLAGARQERDALLRARELLAEAESAATGAVVVEEEMKERTEPSSTDQPPSSSSPASAVASDDKADVPGPADETNRAGDGGSPPLSPPEGSWCAVESEPGTKALMNLLTDPTSAFGLLARSSPLLTTLAAQVAQGQIGPRDLRDELDEAVGQRESGGMAALKKEAFAVAGDMGTAMKMLMDHAVPRQRDDPNTEVLACIFDFFLDLCQEGEFSSVAFFWQQLCHIHLRMLPPENYADLVRVELMQDFLLTVAARYSVHLALELCWSHTADLEDSLNLGSSSLSPVCRRRRFAIMHFLCELESLLFDYADGFGSGSVALGRIFVPTADQADRMRLCMQQIRELRQNSPCRLARSYRHEKWSNSKFDKSPELAVDEKLRIARNADYFSSHLNFTKRICDITDKLRHMETEERPLALTEELDLLNSSGAMGGDPLNIAQKSLIRVVRVPSTEGHVFRSKERTPVLLLMEIVDEESKHAPVYKEAEFKAAFETEPVTAKATNVMSTPHIGAEPNSTESLPASEQLANESGSQSEAAAATSEEGTLKDKHISTESSLNTSIEKGSGEQVDVLTGSFQYSEPMPRSPKTAGLRRFDGSDVFCDPSTPKKEVEDLLSNVAVQQLQIPASLDLPALPTSQVGLDGPVGEDSVLGASQDTDVSNSENTDSEQDDSATKRSMDSETKHVKKNLVRSRINDVMNTLAPTGDTRREVLNTIMMRGMEGNTIAAGTAESVQRSLRELERQRATELLLGETDGISTKEDEESTRQRLVSLGITATISTEQIEEKRSEEDEVMESIRLLLIQHRVAQGKLSPADAAKVLQHTSINRTLSDSLIMERAAKGLPPDRSDCPTVDAGDIDRRLIGCGPLPPAVLQALTLWKGEMVTNAELLELVKKDILFVKHSVLYDAENTEKLVEDSDFWGRFAFGERWAEKKARIASASPVGMTPGWDLQGIIVKSNDDLRQEQFIMQLIELSQEAFELAGLELWVSPYRILATGRSTGIIEMVRNAMSFDALKKRPGYGKGGLREHLNRMCEFTADPGKSLKSAQQNFVRSLAAYSLISYFFQVKDRHNGNLLLDTAGHMIHIDFGFVFGKAPGGSFSLEMYSPFKLTEEMIEVMGGLKSPMFSEFVTLFSCGFLALQSHCSTFLTITEIMCTGSTFKCFDGRTPEEVVEVMRDRFRPDYTKEQTVAFALDLISQAATSYGTRQYDLFQYMSQGIAA